MVDALVNVDLAEVTLVAGQAVARVIGQRIQTFGAVLALVVVAQSALELQIIQLGSANGPEFSSRWVAQQVRSGEEGQQQSADAEFVQTAAIRHRIGKN